MFVCPECAQGKHRNCDGNAWDPSLDELTGCTCPDEIHRPLTPST